MRPAVIAKSGNTSPIVYCFKVRPFLIWHRLGSVSRNGSPVLRGPGGWARVEDRGRRSHLESTGADRAGIPEREEEGGTGSRCRHVEVERI